MSYSERSDQLIVIIQREQMDAQQLPIQEFEEAKRNLGVDALAQAYRGGDVAALRGAFSFCCSLGIVDEEIRAWYVTAWRALVKSYEEQGKTWKTSW